MFMTDVERLDNRLEPFQLADELTALALVAELEQGLSDALALLLLAGAAIVTALVGLGLKAEVPTDLAQLAHEDGVHVA